MKYGSTKCLQKPARVPSRVNSSRNRYPLGEIQGCVERIVWAYCTALIEANLTERQGRKATGLQRGAMTAGLPARRKIILIRASDGKVLVERKGRITPCSFSAACQATHSGTSMLP